MSKAFVVDILKKYYHEQIKELVFLFTDIIVSMNIYQIVAAPPVYHEDQNIPHSNDDNIEILDNAPMIFTAESGELLNTDEIVDAEIIDNEFLLILYESVIE